MIKKRKEEDEARFKAIEQMVHEQYKQQRQNSAEKVIQVVSNSSGSSFGFNKWSIECINRNFRDGYAMGEAVKDWHLLEKISKEKINTISSSETSSALGPVAAAAQNVYFDTLNEIDDAKDSHKGIMIKLHEKRLGVKVIKQK